MRALNGKCAMTRDEKNARRRELDADPFHRALTRKTAKKWRDRNLEKIKAKRRAWYAENAERERARQRAWNAAHKDKRAAAWKKWADANRERLRARDAARYATAADKARRALLQLSFNIGREHFKGVKNRETAVVYRQEPDYTGVNKYPYGTSVELWYIDADDTDVSKMVSSFKVDSSKIVRSEDDYSDGRPTPDQIDEMDREW